MAEGNGLFHLVQEQFTPNFIRSLLFRPPLTGRGDPGQRQRHRDRGRLLEQGPETALPPGGDLQLARQHGHVHRRPGHRPGAARGWRPPSNSPSTRSRPRQTPLLQSAAAPADRIRADGALLASFAAGSIGLEQDITVRSDRTLNATTADFAQFFVGSTAATGAFTSSSSITATQQIESDLRVQAPLLRCDPAASVLTVTGGGTQGVLVDDTLRVNGVIAPEASLPFLSLSRGSSGVQVLSPLLEQIAVAPNSSVGLVARNAAATGDASLILDSNAQNGLVELKALAGGGVQMNTLFQFMSFNTTNGLANLAIEPNIGGSNNGELIFGSAS